MGISKNILEKIDLSILCLSSYGRDIKWNPHIHILIAEMKLSNNKIQDWSYFNYDGNNVTFCYNVYEDESYHEETVTAEKFILMLLRHLIPSNYKIIRYYGFIGRNVNYMIKLNCL